MPELKKKAGLGSFRSDDNKDASTLLEEFTSGLGKVATPVKKVAKAPAKKPDQSKDLDFLTANDPSAAVLAKAKKEQNARRLAAKAKKQG